MIRTFSLLWLLVVALSASVFAQSDSTETPTAEVRGFWADGFNPGIKSEAEIDALVERLHKAHCNAIFAQIRKRGDAYYWSSYEPRAIDNQDANFDPLATLIRKAHAAHPRITVHAWINTCAVGGIFAPGHILACHPEYRSLSDKGETYDNEAVKIDPGVPSAADWTARVYLDVARHYDVDGIHFDFVRYGGVNWGYAPESVARYGKKWEFIGNPNPIDPRWQQWRRDQVTALVRRVYANAMAIKPNLVVSAALIPWGDAPKSEKDWANSSAYSRVYQDWRAWLQEGILDLGCPMTYFRSDKYKPFQEHWSEWIRNHQYNRAATIAVGTWFNTIDESMALARLSREPSPATGKRAAGILFYSYQGTDALLQPDGKRKELAYDETFYDTIPTLFPDALPFPTFPWKTAPTAGHIKGNVLTGEKLEPADDVTVTVSGMNPAKPFSRTIQTDGNGFYAFIDVPPGTYTVTVQDGEETSNPTRITVAAGAVENTDFFMHSGNLPDLSAVFGVGSKPEGSRVTFKAISVSVGNTVLGDRCFVCDAGTDHKRPIEVRLPALPMPLIPGDLVTLTGTLKRQDGKLTVVADTVRWVGCTL